MIKLIQFPWSPFCLVSRRILEYSGVRFKLVNIPNTDRRLVWKLTKHRYYQVPILQDGKTVVFETSDTSQVIAKYLDSKLGLDLFPRNLAGVQHILWRYIESEIEDRTFKLTDVYFEENLPPSEILNFVRHKERKFGRGCLAQWKVDQGRMVSELTDRLGPFEQMLGTRPFLLDNQPHFVDFDLYGMLANFLYTGHYQLPEVHPELKRWYDKISTVKRPAVKA
jgi:glutathione S-transferase